VELQSQRFEVDDYWQALETIYEKGWTDGLPVVPPTRSRVEACLDAIGVGPDQIVGEIPERNRVVRAEKLAINAVMAGCRPEYMPVLVAAVEAICDPRFKFNHLASLGSPTPMLIVSGPIVRELGFNWDRGVMGPSSRANATIGRAISLLLWNVAELRPDAIQRGTYGNPLRWTSGCISENPNDLGWQSLREHLGFDAADSTVTVISNWGAYTQTWAMKPDAMDTLNTIADATACGSGNFCRGVYTVLLAPPIIERFVSQGWSRQKVRDWLFENTGRTIAELKRRGRWGYSSTNVGEYAGNIHASDIEPGDTEKFVYLFRQNPGLDEILQNESQLTRENDIYLVATGGDVISQLIVIAEYGVSTNPVTKRIRR